MADPEASRSKLELAYMVSFTVLTFALGAALTLGVPALLLIRAVDQGATARGLISAAAAAVWISALVYAVIRNRETRGWFVFALVGWVSYVRPLLRRLRLDIRR
jgi:hypothetical protein